MDLGFCFGMMCGAEINLSKIVSPNLVRMARCKNCTVQQVMVMSWNVTKNIGI